jgi:nicotinamidase-related amidase
MSLQQKNFRPLPALLICADLQQDELDGGAVPGRCDEAVRRCELLLACWRSHHWPVLHLKRIARASWFEASPAGSDWIDGCRPMPGELAFEHALPSGYSSSRFAEYMRSVRPETSIFIGLSLDQTILSSTIDGFHRGYRHHVVTDAVDTVRQPPASRDTLVTVLNCYSSSILSSGLLVSERAGRAGDFENEK